MNRHFENRAALTANSTVSSTLYGTASGRPSGLTAAKRWVSFLPLKLMSPDRKSGSVFSAMKSMMSASLAKLIYALGMDKKRAIQDNLGVGPNNGVANAAGETSNHRGSSGDVDITEIDESGWDADDEESDDDGAASPRSDSDVTYEYDDHIHRGGSDDGQCSSVALDACFAEMKAKAARKHNEWLRNGPMSPHVIRVPLWILEEVHSGKYPNSGLKYLLEPKADGPMYSVKGMSLDMGGFIDLKLKGVTAQELRRRDEIAQRVVEHGIGSSLTGALFGTSTVQEHIDITEDSESWVAEMRALGLS